MPVIDVMFAEGTLNTDQQQSMATTLTDILMTIEGTKGNPQFAAGTWLTLTPVAPTQIAVGGQPGAYPAAYRVIIHVPAGALPLAAKEAIVAQMTDALLTIEGSPHEPRHRARVYCLINEVADGGWGFAGNVYTLEKLRAARPS